MTEPASDYERGVLAGEIAARLANHDMHFATINGTLIRLAEVEAERLKGIVDLTLAVQRLGDQAEANAATVITTAKALKDAGDARRQASDQSWTPWQRIIAVVGGLVSVSILLAVAAQLIK